MIFLIFFKKYLLHFNDFLMICYDDFEYLLHFYDFYYYFEYLLNF